MPLTPLAPYPQLRLRRFRMHAWQRTLVQEHRLHASDLIWPVFVCEGHGQRQPIDSLPGVERLSIDLLVQEVQEAAELGIPMVALFCAIDPTLKDDAATEAFNPNNLACRAIRAIKEACPNIGVMVDVALDLYTSHGHDGLIVEGVVANDATVEALVKQSLNFANAGADALGPSDMMDGRIGVIRQALEAAGFHDTLLIAYSAKYASALYGPYRDAVGSANNLNTPATTVGASKATYQQHPANVLEALREGALDASEGADALMVKPALYYLDVIYRLKEATPLPMIAYHVSGEYAMVCAAAEKGWLDKEKVLHEALLSLKRAGCDAIITYAAKQMARHLKVGRLQ
ncbi:MAG: porphobilinogen synthase [Vampirovibrionales bacterium]